MNKAELIEAIADDVDMGQAAAVRVLNALMESISKGMTKHSVRSGWAFAHSSRLNLLLDRDKNLAQGNLSRWWQPRCQVLS